MNILNAYRNTCCMCCGIPQVSPRYFAKLDGTKVQVTLDHIVLKSLGGSSLVENLAIMCFNCNQTRGNLFAEMDEFIDWYWSSEELPNAKNFSYLRENPNLELRPYNELTEHDISNIPVLESKKDSKVLDVIVINGIEYTEYVHPLFGKSLVKTGKLS